MIERREDYIEAAEVLGFPTEGHFAERLWRLCSSRLPYPDGAQLYRDCGYIPFSGYPLARSGKFARMTREQVGTACEHNPILRLLRQAK